MNSRNREIDYIKACMAILIILYHYTTRYAEMLEKNPFPIRISNGGTVGVAIFFTISAIYSMQGVEKEHNVNLVRYMFGKVLRLYPAYFASIIIIFAVTSIYKVPMLSISWKSFLANLFLIQRFCGIDAVDGAHWYIAFLLVMYFWLWVIYNTSAYKRFETYLIWIAVSTLFSMDFFEPFGVSLPIIFGTKFNALMNIITLERYSSYVIIGIMLFFLSEKMERKWIFIIGICFVKTTIYVGTLNATVIFLLVLLVFFSYIGKLHISKIYVLDYIGSISYALYLIHQNIGYAILDAFDKAGISQEWSIIVPIIVATALATAITYLVEKPIYEYVKARRKLKCLHSITPPS